MAQAAKEALGVETPQAVADVGYYNSATLKECEENGIVAYVPQPERTGRLRAQGRFTRLEFTYDQPAHFYKPTPGARRIREAGSSFASPAGS